MWGRWSATQMANDKVVKLCCRRHCMEPVRNVTHIVPPGASKWHKIKGRCMIPLHTCIMCLIVHYVDPCCKGAELQDPLYIDVEWMVVTSGSPSITGEVTRRHCLQFASDFCPLVPSITTAVLCLMPYIALPPRCCSCLLCLCRSFLILQLFCCVSLFNVLGFAVSLIQCIFHNAYWDRLSALCMLG